MALYAFETPAFLYIGLGCVATLALLLMVFSFDWLARLRPDSSQRDVRRLAQATAEWNRILGDRERLHAEHALARQGFEAALRDSKAAAASEIAALQAQLEKRDAMLKRLRIRLKQRSAAVKPGADRSSRAARGGAGKSRRLPSRSVHPLLPRAEADRAHL
jgi:hypothetical protein